MGRDSVGINSLRIELDQCSDGYSFSVFEFGTTNLPIKKIIKKRLHIKIAITFKHKQTTSAIKTFTN